MSDRALNDLDLGLVPDTAVRILPRKKVVRRHAGKVHETIKLAAAGASVDPIAAREVNFREAWRREMAERGVLAVHKKTRAFCQTWIMPNDQQGFYARGYSFKKVAQDIDTGAVEQIFDLAGRFLRKFLQHDVKRVARAPGRRNQNELGNETGCLTIGTHARRVCVASRRQGSLKIALGSVSYGFCMANEEEPWHRAK